MSEKSYVTLEQNFCPICGNLHDTGNILIDRKLRDKFEHNTLTGDSLCEDCENNSKTHVALVVVNNAEESVKDRLLQKDADRSGTILWIRKDAAENLFTSSIYDPISKLPMAFISQQVADIITGTNTIKKDD